MMIKRIDIFHIAIPLKRPFETSFGVIDRRPALIIKMTSDEGVVGYGESSPLYVPMSETETLADGLNMLKRALPACISAPIDDTVDICDRLDRCFPVTSIGVEGAYLDLLARSKDIPFARLFGTSASSVTVGESVGLQSTTDDVIREVAQYVEGGFSRIKIKIARGKDVDVVRAVRHAFPSLSLGADANAAYTAHDVQHLSALVDCDLAFIEQPFAADDLKSHALLRKAGISVCLDETVRDIETCKRAIAESACDIVNIKPARIGSYRQSKLVHDYCVRSGIALFGGGRLETGIGKTANAHFYSLPGFTEASDLTPPSDYFEADIVEPPFAVQRGTYTISNAPGIGVEVDETALDKFTVERYSYQNE